MRLLKWTPRNGGLPSPGGGEGGTLAHTYGKRRKKLRGEERLPRNISRAISAIIVTAFLRVRVLTSLRDRTAWARRPLRANSCRITLTAGISSTPTLSLKVWPRFRLRQRPFAPVNSCSLKLIFWHSAEPILVLKRRSQAEAT